MIPLFKVAMSPDAGKNVQEVLQSGYIGQGFQVEWFEDSLHWHLNLPSRPLTTNSCTSALDLALELIGVGPGDEVVTTPMTCTATNGVIVKRGAIPVWSDVDERGLIQSEYVEPKITSKTKAIMAVDWAGSLPDYVGLKEFGIPVIQDAAHSFGTGVGGDYVAWSFQAIKHLTTGDGGALLVPQHQYERAKLLRWYGLDRESSDSFRCAQDIREVGFKYHMNNIAATIGNANLQLALSNVWRHRSNAKYIYENLGLEYDPYSSHWFVNLLVPDRDGFIARMEARGVTCSPVHARNDKHTAFHFPNGPLPGVDHFADHTVAVPCGWWLSPDDLDEIVWAVYTSTDTYQGART